jgi:hypothetical protein
VGWGACEIGLGSTAISPLDQKGLALRCLAPSIACARGRAAGSFRLKVLITGEERLFGADAALCYVRVLPDLDGNGTTEFFLGGGLITVLNDNWIIDPRRGLR